MIKYDLKCDQGHRFESWFRSSSDYDDQQIRGLSSCPICGSTDLSKQLMAPGIPAKSNKTAREVTGSTEVPVTTGLDERQIKMVEMIREFREAVIKQADDVGENFTEEARKIHYGEAEPRGIYGKATPPEAEELLEEGIDVLPIPVLPEDRN